MKRAAKAHKEQALTLYRAAILRMVKEMVK